MGERYRIIDFTLSNCLHSGLRRVLVLTQYKSHSLQKHLRDGWSIYNSELGEYITPVPPQMRTGKSWYSGTADAIYQNLYLLERSGAEYALILSGDHVYRMDYDAMLQRHRDSGAALTVACLTVGLEEASSFGAMTVDEDDRIVSFQEKPKTRRAFRVIPATRSHPWLVPTLPERSLRGRAGRASYRKPQFEVRSRLEQGRQVPPVSGTESSDGPGPDGAAPRR